jgi:hypothetical protein
VLRGRNVSSTAPAPETAMPARSWNTVETAPGPMPPGRDHNQRDHNQIVTAAATAAGRHPFHLPAFLAGGPARPHDQRRGAGQEQDEVDGAEILYERGPRHRRGVRAPNRCRPRSSRVPLQDSANLTGRHCRPLRVGSIVDRMSTSDTLVLPPDAASERRRTYVKFLVFELVVTAVLQVGYLVWVPHSDEKAGPTVLVGNMLTTGSLLLLLLAVLAGLSAIRNDRIYLSGLRTSRWLARLGSIAGWVGAPLALAIGIIQKSNGVSEAFVDALFVGTCALVAGTLNEAAHRLARRAATPP